MSRAAKRGGVKRGGFSRSGLGLPFLSFFVLFWDFPDFSGIFPICSGMDRGFSRFVLFLFLGLLRAPTRNSPERVRDTIWTFPERSVGNPRVWKPPGLASLKFSGPRIPFCAADALCGGGGGTHTFGQISYHVGRGFGADRALQGGLGKPPSLETPRFSFSQFWLHMTEPFSSPGFCCAEQDSLRHASMRWVS